MRLEAIDGYVVRVTEAVPAVLLDFVQGEQLVAPFAEQEPAVIGLLTGMTGVARHCSSRQPHPAAMPIRWSPAGLAIGDRACGKGQSLQRKLLYFAAALGSGLNVELAGERGRVSDQLGGPAGQWLLRCRC